MVNVGGIVSVGGFGGASNGGSSGIQSINSETGPAIIVNGVNGIEVNTTTNVITINGASLSGLVSPDGSGINAINGDIGPNVDFIGVNGIEITADGNGEIVVDGAGASGTVKFSDSFSNIISGQFVHNLGTRDVIVQVYEESPLYEQILPDRVIMDTPNIVSLLFTRPQSGRIIVLG